MEHTKYKILDYSFTFKLSIDFSPFLTFFKQVIKYAFSFPSSGIPSVFIQERLQKKARI